MPTFSENAPCWLALILVKLRELFPQGFAFAQARQLFDAWLVQAGDDYNEQAIQAMWIGFAHRICDLYHEKEDSSSQPDYRG